jgi:hypothetical protein
MTNKYMQRLMMLLEAEGEDSTQVGSVFELPWDLPDTKEPDIEINPGRRGGRRDSDPKPSKGEEEVDWRNVCDAKQGGSTWQRVPPVTILVNALTELSFICSVPGSPKKANPPKFSVQQVVETNQDILTIIEQSVIIHSWERVYWSGSATDIRQQGSFDLLIWNLISQKNHGYCMTESFQRALGRALGKLVRAKDRHRRLGIS